MAETKPKFWDRRTMDRYVEKGIHKPADVQNHLKGLPDDTNNAEWVNIELEEAELGGHDSDSNSNDDEEA